MEGLSNIFARNCEIRRIDKAEASAFLAACHRLGSTGGRYRYGIYVRRTTGSGELRLECGTLVAVAVFSNARRWKKEEGTVASYEWIRYASLPGVRVVGGMGKALSRFIEDVRPDDVMTYADLSGPDGGEVYEKLGFVPEADCVKSGSECRKYRYRVSP